MGEVHDSGTRVSLLGRLRRDPSNQAYWSEFVEYYGAKIYAWCRHWRLQEADAQDVTQMVLLRLAEKMRDFQYDPTRSFRAWLRTLSHNALSDFFAKHRRPGAGTGDSEVVHLLYTVEARQDFLARLEEEFDRELLEMAVTNVRLRVEPQTWEAFRLTALEGMSGAEAAALIPMQVAQVFVAKRRVQQMLQKEIARLEQDVGGEESP